MVLLCLRRCSWVACFFQSDTRLAIISSSSEYRLVLKLSRLCIDNDVSLLFVCSKSLVESIIAASEVLRQCIVTAIVHSWLAFASRRVVSLLEGDRRSLYLKWRLFCSSGSSGLFQLTSCTSSRIYSSNASEYDGHENNIREENVVLGTNQVAPRWLIWRVCCPGTR